ncbi:MAG: MarR family transcriptional regulator [Anaerolineales bacterium]|nr:MarR family transcriptional regulator [Anaerolineales bacterium]
MRNYELCSQACLARHGVTTSQGYTLLALPGKGTVSMNKLSEAMGLASSTMTRMVDQLVHNKLVWREPDEEDRRVVQVGLTSQGRQVQEALEQELQEFFKQVLGEMPREERPAVLHALETITHSIAKVRNLCCSEQPL